VQTSFLAYLQANRIASAYWAAGPWWGDYPLAIEPTGIGSPTGPVDRPQMIVLRQYPG
jgi:endoglucanase